MANTSLTPIPGPARAVLVCLAFGAVAAVAWSTRAAAAPSLVGAYACLPRDQLREARRCPDVGPGGEVERRARNGESDHPLPTRRADPDLSYVPFNYLRVKEDGGSLYPSAEAAASGSGATDSLPTGFVFLSYIAAMDVSGTTVYATGRGFVRGDGITEITPLGFHGLSFSRTPDRPFGWVVSGTFTQREPGGAEDWVDHWLPRLTMVTIRDSVQVDGVTWYEVGPGEWVEQTLVGVVTPDPTPPEGADGDRWIRVNLYEQTLEAYQGGELVFATLTSTGRYGYWTQPGLFKVWIKLERDLMTGGLSGPDGGNYYYLEDVPWVLYFDQSRGLHGTYWHGRFGTSTSRGCVNLSAADAHWIYNFAEVDTWVYVWDPSGQTPTDPALYGSGGA
jgi:hypothetical protein